MCGEEHLGIRVPPATAEGPSKFRRRRQRDVELFYFIGPAGRPIGGNIIIMCTPRRGHARAKTLNRLRCTLQRKSYRKITRKIIAYTNRRKINYRVFIRPNYSENEKSYYHK